MEGADGTNDGDISAANPLPVDGSGVTQPVSAASLPLPTGAATAANQTTQITSLQLLDDVVVADDAAFTPGTTKVSMAGAEFDDTTPDSVDEGDAGALRMSSRRELYTQIRDAAGNERGANVTAGNKLAVDGSGVTLTVASHDVTNAGTFAVQVSAALPAGSANIGDVDVLTVPAPLSTTGGGTEATAHRVTIANDSTGVLSVDDNGSSLTVDGSVTANAGTNLNTSALALESGGNLAGAATSLALLDDVVFADDAAFTVGTSKVLAVGGNPVAHGSAPDAADAGDAAIPIMNRHRVLWTIGGHPNAVTSVYLTTGAQTDDNVLPAISSGTKYAITRVSVTVDADCTVTPGCRLGFGTSTVPTLPTSGSDAVADLLVYHPGFIPGGGITVGDGSGVLGVGGDGAELRITCDAPTGGSLAVSVTWFSIES